MQAGTPPECQRKVTRVKFWYDTEFLDNGRTIDLISIGIVAEDGREFYAINEEAPWSQIKAHPWLMDNVVANLPPILDPEKIRPSRWLFDMADPAVKAHARIATDVKRFLLDRNEPVELWGYYPSYDHVVLAQLWGPMVNLPRGIPMKTNCVEQWAEQLEIDGLLPQQTGMAHNALDDAKWHREMWEYCNAR